eukprot:9834039-Heterocapsa_arctica.AAC.1
MNAKHNLELLKQSLEDQKTIETNDLGNYESMMLDVAETKANDLSNKQNRELRVFPASEDLLSQAGAHCPSASGGHVRERCWRDGLFGILEQMKKDLG